MEREAAGGKSQGNRLLWGNPYGWLDMNHSSHGVNSVAQEGIKRLRQKGYDIITVGPHVGDDQYNIADAVLGNTWQLPRLLTEVTGTTYPLSLPFRKERATELMLKTKPDALVMEQPDQGLAGHSLISGTEIREDGKPLIPIMVRFHGNVYNEFWDAAYRILLINSLKLVRRPRFTKLGWSEGVANTVLNSPVLHIVTSRAIEAVSIKRYGKKDYRLLSNGIDTDKFTPAGPLLEEWKRDGKEIILIAMGRVEKRKGVVNGVEAYKLIKAQRPNTKLIIAGDGPEKESLKQKVELEQIKDVAFVGRLTREEYAKALRTADVGLYTAIGGEGWGIVVGEGLASGLISVVSNIAGYAEVTEGGQPFALIAEPNNPEDIAAKALQIFRRTEEEKQNLKRQAAAYIRARFAWEIIIRALEGYLGEILNKQSRVDWDKAREDYARKPKFFPPRGTLYIARKN